MSALGSIIAADYSETQKDEGRLPSAPGCQPTASAVPASQSGIPDAGKRYRTARKSHRCANASRAERGVAWAQVCQRIIGKGERYEEGEIDLDYAGGFGHERFCMACSDGGLS